MADEKSGGWSGVEKAGAVSAATLALIGLLAVLVQASNLVTAQEMEKETEAIRQEQAVYHATQEAARRRDMETIKCLLVAIKDRKQAVCL